MKILRRIKWALYPLRYLRVMWGMRPWDYAYMLKMLQFQIKEYNRHKTLKGVSEYPDDEKVAVRRSIELIEGVLKGDYWERCGYDYNYSLNWEPDESGKTYTLTGTSETKEQARLNDIARKKGNALEEKEWGELWDIVKNNMRKWWD